MPITHPEPDRIVHLSHHLPPPDPKLVDPGLAEKRLPEHGPVRLNLNFLLPELSNLGGTGQSEEWEEIELVVGSGVGETVMKNSELPQYETLDSAESLRGQMYEVANGFTIPTRGQTVFVGMLSSGTPAGLWPKLPTLIKTS